MSPAGPNWENVIRFLRRSRGMSYDEIRRLNDVQLSAELGDGRPVASAAEVEQAKARGAENAMAKAVAVLDRVAGKYRYSPAAIAQQPIGVLLQVIRQEPEAARTTEAGLTKILDAYRAHHRIKAVPARDADAGLDSSDP